MQSIRYIIPRLLVVSRVVLAIPALWIAYVDGPRWAWLGIAFLAAVSDLYDGRLARRWDVVSAGLRQADSVADTVFALAVAISLYLYEPAIMTDYGWAIGLIIFLEAIRYPLDWARFRRGASYHALSARLFGFGILVSVFFVVGFGVAWPVLGITLLLGVISELEGIAISLVLPEWTHDVKHLGRALSIRREAER